MLSLDQPSLWDLTMASGPLSRRFVLDDRVRITLDALNGRTTLGERRDQVLGASVVVKTSGQLATTLSLLELDGRARRLVLCPPDLAPEQLPFVMTTAEATVVVCDLPMTEFDAAGASCIVTSGPSVIPSGRETAGRFATEWVLFTSGTTGRPKMVVHTLSSLIGAIGRRRPQEADGVWTTFYDIRRYGGLQILLRALVGGGSMVFSSAQETVGDFLARSGAAGITFISGTPSHWRQAALNPAATQISPNHVRLSGEMADQPILDKLRALYPRAEVAHAFASTEAGVAFEVADGKQGFPADLIGQERGGVTLRVTDDTLLIRSPRTAARYLGNTADVLADPEGFIDTKDIVERRGDRYHFVGRSDGVINVGGLKVHPEEVETVINRHPSVQMSLVKSRRSPIMGAIVIADVVLAPTAAATGDGAAKALEAEILQACRKTLAWYKVPAVVRIIPSLDVSPSGKLVRRHA
jgi:acyl-coenzyme A synthetase/AMP-(fatty) acid ligase